jgi:transcriptional regulator with XRE-family HTH domain
MTLRNVESCFRRLNTQRALVKASELELVDAVGMFLKGRPETLRELAGKLGLSVAYLSDICHRRRNVSDKVMEKLRELQ